ncbi:cation transporter [Haloprofundus marisrubri]|uniref:Cation transporter n=1 Tax=Haloprofundus marisrubri TaxID=1514971 RepID=A0A0W1R4I4_9EURY|nr:cation diffusion facilitator family transporter [Haloprofundus marisrubri]KTG08135.1 cation transporter [Haloprofundus marisrubri]
MAGSKSVVIAALIANGAIAVMKFLGYLLTGSPSMLSETYHSISDTGNQVFLLVGIRYSGKKPDREHPFGYGKSQFFYSFLVAVMLFGIAGWESAKHGYEAIMHPGHGAGYQVIEFLGFNFNSVWVNVVVLVGAIGFETYAFVKANEELQRQIREFNWSGIPEAFRKTSDVTTLTAFTEDAIALGGAAIALVGVLLSFFLGAPIYDAVASLVIGFLLMGFAIALAWENKRLLIGESLPADIEQKLRSIVADHPGVTGIDSFRSMYVGSGEALINTEVRFDGELVTGDIDTDIAQLKSKLKQADSRVSIVNIEPEA